MRTTEEVREGGPSCPPSLPDERIAKRPLPHVLRKRGVLEGTALAAFLALVHTANDAITAILGPLLPTLQERFDAGRTLLALIVAVYFVASSVTQPLFGSLAGDLSLRAIGALGVIFAAIFLSLIGVTPALWLVFVLLGVGQLRCTQSGRRSPAHRRCETVRSASASSPPAAWSVSRSARS
jgi:MFS family permease